MCLSGCERMRDCVCCARVLFPPLPLLYGEQEAAKWDQLSSNTSWPLFVCVCVHMSLQKCFFSHFLHGSHCSERSHTSPGHGSWARLDWKRSSKPVTVGCPNMDELQIPQEWRRLFLGLAFFLCAVVVLREKEKKGKKVTHQLIDVCASVCEQVCLSCSRASKRTGFLSGFFLYKKIPKQQDEQWLSEWEVKVSQTLKGHCYLASKRWFLCDKLFRSAPGKADLFVLAAM